MNEKTGARETEAVVIGCGKVGTEFLDLLASGVANGVIRLVAIGNTRGWWKITQKDWRTQLARAPDAVPGISPDSLFAVDGQPGMIIDLTADPAISDHHSGWLDDGIHVVTANKHAAAKGEVYRRAVTTARYGDSATVGAGLPILSSLRRLQQSGDHVREVTGVLSGTLTFICAALNSGQCFSEAVKAAIEHGYAEPDPNQDLAGQDVALKLAIIAHAARLPLPGNITAYPLIPPGYAGRPADCPDETWNDYIRSLRRRGKRLVYAGKITDAGEVRIGPTEVESSDVLGQLSGTGNLARIFSERYSNEPLIVHGPGAGPALTAGNVLADVLAIAGYERKTSRDRRPAA